MFCIISHNALQKSTLDVMGRWAVDPPAGDRLEKKRLIYTCGACASLKNQHMTNGVVKVAQLLALRS